ncbi:MAG: DNA repair protein RecN [Lachnospiraceae bacterium]|nr:DNA repair protein RecN [Lachnospiraceae bacterium]
MLSNVHVKNFALIDEADIGLDDNLNILTGETGAGKSILLGAVNLALGGRASKDVVRQNADFCLAELTFNRLSPAALEAADELGIECSDDEIVISRKLMSNGKSVIRVNSETVSAAAVRKLTGELIDIYGQNEHISLLSSAKHLDIIDRFAGEEAGKLKQTIKAGYAEYKKLQDEYDGLENDPARRARDIDRLNSEIEEIENAAIKDGEEEELKDRRRVLMNAGQIIEALNSASEALYGSDGCSDLLSQAVRALSRVEALDEKLSGYLDDLSDIDSRLSDIYRDIKDYLDSMPESDEELENVEQRLELVMRLKSKFGNSLDEINEYLENDKEELNKLLDFENYTTELKKKLESSKDSVMKQCIKLSGMRKKAAEALKKRISDALLDLNFNQARFDIDMSVKDEPHAEGIDSAEFLISLNPGEELKSLSRIASGGEMSRIMLGIISVFASRETIDTLIFDEIDTGISGIAASKVADKLCSIAEGHQVICITHLPQIAAMADAHFKVEKSVENSKTVVSIERLEESGITGELARILGGEESSGSVMKAAADIKNSTTIRKNEIRRKKFT